jgi:hypothetical protein
VWFLKMSFAVEAAPGNRKEVAAEIDLDIAPKVVAEVDTPAVDKEAGREAADIPLEVGPNQEPGYKDFENNLVAADKEAEEAVEEELQNKIRNSCRPDLHMKQDYYNLDNKNIAAS